MITHTAPGLLALPGVRTETAGQLLVTAGDTPDRLVSEASFAHLRAAAPVPASSGRTDRQRLNRGGDRQANRVLPTIVLVRMRHDPRTRNYVARLHPRRAQDEGHLQMAQALRRERSTTTSPAHHQHIQPLDDL
ncbi:transposase [Streptomyces sp. NPDC088387]|uniref:transposase n=1 Tax=Streptomyces sp. NPDC088387 TaxID=3365859 RepID=UPI00381F635A